MSNTLNGHAIFYEKKTNLFPNHFATHKNKLVAEIERDTILQTQQNFCHSHFNLIALAILVYLKTFGWILNVFDTVQLKSLASVKFFLFQFHFLFDCYDVLILFANQHGIA